MSYRCGKCGYTTEYLDELVNIWYCPVCGGFTFEEEME